MSQFSFLDTVVVGLTLIASTVGIYQIISNYKELQKEKGKFRNKISEAKSKVLQHQ